MGHVDMRILPRNGEQIVHAPVPLAFGEVAEAARAIPHERIKECSPEQAVQVSRHTQCLQGYPLG